MSASARTWSSFDSPELLAAVSIDRGDGRREALIAVDGMHCAACSSRLERTLVDAATDIRVNLTAKTVEFRWRPDLQPLSALLQRIEQAGFTPTVLGQDAALPSAAADQRAALQRIGIATICAMQVMMLAWPAYWHAGEMSPALLALLRFSQWLLATPAVIYSGYPFFASAIHALRQRSVNMDVPVALALALAYLVSATRTLSGHGEIYFDTATMFVMLLASGRYLEGRTRAIATERLRILAGRRALTATRMHDGHPEVVAISVLVAGDRVLVASGEAVPVDGTLLDADAELDESLLTGEAHPVTHAAGSKLLAGSINLGPGALQLQAEAPQSQSRLSQITRMLNRAQSERPRYQTLVDRISGGFVLGVMLLAAIAALWWWPQGADRSLSVALAVLVASCPCALALAVPAVIAAASSHLAGNGVLLARTQALVRLPEVDTVLFDKTGTLTRSQIRLEKIVPLADLPADQCGQIAAALEAGNSHPIARAFDGLAGNLRALELQPRAARGVQGRIDDRLYRLGAAEHADADDVRQQVQAQSAMHGPHLSWLLLERDAQPLALFGLLAEIRPEAAAVLAQLRDAGLKRVLLTGDSPATAAHVAQQLGIDTVMARCLPQDKLAQLQILQRSGHVVMAVGDGINDAPLLAAADVAVAMPQGAALAQSQADAILTGENLRGLTRLLQTARRARTLTRQNLGWAVGYNLLVLPLAMTGLLSPWLAALGMSLSSLLVVGNALRVTPLRHASTAAQA